MEIRPLKGEKEGGVWLTDWHRINVEQKLLNGYQWNFEHSFIIDLRCSLRNGFKTVSYTHLDAYKRQVWRIGDKGLYEGFPAVVHHFWRKLPENLTHIDDVYERNDGKIVFFVGKYIICFQNKHILTMTST